MNITDENIINTCKTINRKIVGLLKKSDFDVTGLFGGKAGVLLFLNQLYGVSKDNNVKSIALNLLDEIFEDIQKKELKFDLSEGVVGIASAIIYISKNDFINSNIKVEITDTLDKHIFQSLDKSIALENYDLLTGYLGTGLYFLEKQTLPYASAAIEKIVNAINSQATYDKDKEYIFFYDYMSAEDEDELQVNLGLAHGMPAIVIFLCKLIKSGYPVIKINSIIEKSINWILDHQVKKSDHMFPGLIPDYSKTRLSWCYGDLDIALMLYYAGNSLNNIKWIDKSKEIAIHSSHRRDLDVMNIWDSCFCHGTAGISYIFSKLSAYHSCTKLGDADEYWFKLTYKNAISKDLEMLKTYNPEQNIFEFDPSLLDGLSGIGLVLLSKINKELNAWDHFFLLS